MPKKKNKKMHERTIDNINIALRLLEIREKFPELKDISIKRIIAEGWTTSEILSGKIEDNIFIPACKFSCVWENQIQYFYIPMLTSRQWSKYTARDKKTLLTKIQKNGKYLWYACGASLSWTAEFTFEEVKKRGFVQLRLPFEW